ncbi:MAG: CotH kinase family protein [Candidatus Neomarinimicrobiota bacterium]
MKYLLIAITIIFISSFGLGQSIQINEVVSSNGDSFYDEDGDTPDWIEIYNPSDELINLSGYGITDDVNDLLKWTFPSYDLAANDFLVVFASNKDRKDYVVQWDAKIDWGDTWRYWIGNSAPISDWELPQTDIGFWPQGQSGFGYGDNDDNTEIPQTVSVYVRKEFEIEDPSIILKALFHIDYDDGYIAYLNGIEFSRRNLGSTGSVVYHTSTTTGLHEAEIYAGGFPETVDIDLMDFPILEGINTLAVQVHNYTSNSSDLSCIPFLTLGYGSIVDGVTEPSEYITIPNSFLHTNFRLDSDGETLLLSTGDENILDSINVIELETDMSFGRQAESNQWGLFDEPTPGTSNPYSSYEGSLSKPQFSLESGFYDSNQLQIELESNDDGASIHFTLDGSPPTPSDLEYEYPITINSSTVVRARSFLDGWVKSNITTKTYLLSEEPPAGLPAIFITTDLNSFFDDDTGMYVMGPNADTWNFPYFGANFWEDWERPIHFEILEVDGTGYDADAGVKIFGGWSRAFPQKSLSIFSRSHIGPSVFEYKLFPNSDIEKYESFVLRNSGNDWESTMLRDGFITGLTDELDIDHQRYRPSALYINGEFWGIQNIREKVNEHFIASNHSISSEHIDLLDIQGVNDENIVHGTNTDYIELINYLETQNINDPAIENALDNWIDIDSYMSYQAFQIFVDNRDWPGNNIKFWRDHRVGGKWRWILYDTDFGFGIWDQYAYTFNTLRFALDPNGPGWPNPPWSTFVFRKLMENENFQNSFINIYCDMLNTVLLPEFLTTRLDSISGNIEEMIPVHRARWFNDGEWPNSTTNWENRLNQMENFADQRRNYAIMHLMDEFELPSLSQITIARTPESGGLVKVNTIDISETSWQGYYFPTVPIQVKAIHSDGFEFGYWLEFPDSSSTMNLDIQDAMTLTAVFLPTELTSGSLVINEINYNSSEDHESGDWIEIFNPGDMDIDISGYKLKDDNNDHSYNFPDETIIPSGEYLVISNDLEAFSELYSSQIPIVGPFDFGFGGGGDEVRIFDQEGVLVDSVSYDDGSPWPLEPDGGGPTLELKNSNLDNELAESWSSSSGFGSPGEQNTSYLNVNDLKDPGPEEYALLNAYPNPFNGSINIPIIIPSQTNSKVIIFNVLGQKVTEISIEHFGIGKHTISWNGQNELGNDVGSGVYFAQLDVEGAQGIQKLVYLK